ncbi:MAG: hypothetical protein M1837_006050 [Sclerophora amabilis]|nr:MAG: hypothetical protein M1837_006050 [Sclerophora amabilis]
MRNLTNIECIIADCPPEPPLKAVSWDAAHDSLIIAFGPSAKSSLISVKRLRQQSSKATKDESSQIRQEDVAQEIASWDAQCPLPDLDCDEVLCLHYFADDSTACLVFCGGDIVIVREEPLEDQDKIEVVGSVDAGITAAKWSPDEELLAITTREGTLLFMTRDFDSVTDVALSKEDLDASRHVSVGWGKSETQFKGKRAKALRDPTMPEHIDEGTLSPLDRRRVALSWRGDGAFVAISSIESDTRRVIRVYSRDCALDSVSEPIDGLEGALSWRPAGNLIASIQRSNDSVRVVFFERNGLRHGQFDLRLSKEEMQSWGADIQLEWNTDSSVLAVHFKDRVQLWTMGNYHYYLKQEILLSDIETFPSMVLAKWHSEKPLRLVLCSKENLKITEYASMTSGGSTTPPNDFGALGVIDGRGLKLTPLRRANVPPPMALHEVFGDSNIVEVAFSQSGSRVAILHQTSFCIYSWDPKSTSSPKQIQYHDLDFPSPHEKPQTQQICFLRDSEVFVLVSSLNVSTIIGYKLDSEGSQILKSWHVSDLQVVRLFARSDNERICIETADNGVAVSDVSRDSLTFEKVISLSTRLPWIELIHLKQKSISFGLSSNGVLYANEQILVRNCTSFMITTAHLIYTTTNHLLKFVHMNDVENLEVPPDEPETDERCRNIERGARLVTVMPSSFSLILQMPRGNLETIYPRALVLAGLRKSVASKDYKKAFFACRNHRVDMNILHDHAPIQFVQNVALFVQQIKKVEHIDLFLSSLRNEDVSKIMYKETYPSGSDLPTPLGDGGDIDIKESDKVDMIRPSKVNRICDAFLAVLSNRSSTNIQNIITAHVCKQPPDLEAGLSVVDNLKRENPELADTAVEHICFLADVNRLFDSALGLYKLDLALLIAQQSQKDPREYLPYLQGLQEMEELRRRFAIDNDLKRYSKGLRHLHEMNAFDELKSYTVSKGLYQEAFDIYRYQVGNLNQLIQLYAEHLDSKAAFKEAGIAYEFLSDYGKAIQAYRSAGCWREALSCASLALLPASEITDLAVVLADTLYESKDYFSAATLYLDYRDDVETAARYFCKGLFFADAMRMIGLKGRHDLFESVIDQGLGEGLANSTELLAECKAQLNAQVPRLREVRTKREEDPLAYFGGDPATTADNDIPDNVSLAPTDASTAGAGGSLFTRYTNRTSTSRASTSRGRKREERKRARGKKGSVYEEEYLVNSIRRLMERVESVREEVGRLIEALVRRRMRERAMAVEKAMAEVVGMCEACREEVFGSGPNVAVEAPAELNVQPEKTTPGTEEYGASENQGVVAARRTDPIPPPIKAFERLSLLGSEA